MIRLSAVAAPLVSVLSWGEVPSRRTAPVQHCAIEVRVDSRNADLLGSDGDSEIARYNLAVTLASEGRTEEAQSLLLGLADAPEPRYDGMWGQSRTEILKHFGNKPEVLLDAFGIAGFAMAMLGEVAEVSGDDVAAEEWFRRASRAGHALSRRRVGDLCRKRGAEAEARSWYVRAMYALDYSAYNHLGVALTQQGDREKAEHWWSLGAERGVEECSLNLADLYLGEGEYLKAAAAIANLSSPDAENIRGKIAWRQGDRLAADRFWENAARGGHVESMVLLAGNPDEDAHANTEHWLRMAADKGNVLAMRMLAERLGEKGSHQEAFRWYASAGSVEAMTAAGFKAGVLNDLELAEVWFRRAAETGDPQAMFNLGAFLDENGREDEAASWWRRAAEQGESHSAHNLGNWAHACGDPHEAERWWRQAAQAGEPDSMNNLAILLQETGRGDEAKRWRANVAALEGSVIAMVDLGEVLEREGLFAEACGWYELAVSKGDNGRAANNLGMLHALNNEMGEAARWFRHVLTTDGAPEAMINLATVLHTLGDVEGCLEWLTRAASVGLPLAMHQLGVVLETEGDLEQAGIWFHRACEAGIDDACKKIRLLPGSPST